MKRAIKYLAAMMAAAILCIALVACGSSGTKYTFKEMSIVTDPPRVGETAPIEQMNQVYQGTTIEVGNGKLVWPATVLGQKQTLRYKVEGDKYDFGGEYLNLLADVGNVSDVTMYGQETEEGFTLVESYMNSGVAFTVTFFFVKA